MVLLFGIGEASFIPPIQLVNEGLLSQGRRRRQLENPKLMAHVLPKSSIPELWNNPGRVAVYTSGVCSFFVEVGRPLSELTVAFLACLYVCD